MSRARDLSRLSNPTNFTADGTTGRVGLGSENPTAKLNVAGIVSATAFYGDGSNLEGVASAGLGTALSDSGPGSVIYYTDKILGIAGNITVDVPDASSSNVAYTQYEEISVESGIDFIVADGDDFVPDILGLSTTGITPLAGTGGRVRADNFTNKAGTGAPTFQTGVVVTGVATATTFSGALSGNATSATSATTATTATNAQGLTGTPDIAVRNITGVAATFTGVLTYEDVTNIDSIGIVTARSGLEVSAGTVYLSGKSKEKANVSSTEIHTNQTFDLNSGMVHFRNSGNPGSTTSNALLTYSPSNVNTFMATNDVVTVTIMCRANSGAYFGGLSIDGSSQTVNWAGGSAPTDGSTRDVYVFTIIKTGSSAYTVFGNQTKTA